MNEYTRREEVRWTLIAAVALVLCMAPAVFRLVTAEGDSIPDPAARAAAKGASDRVSALHACVVSADKLVTEIDVFKASAKAAHLDATEADAPAPKRRTRGKPPKDKEPDAALAWPSAQPSHKQAKALVPCRTQVEAAGARADTAATWLAIAKAAEVAAPGADAKEQIGAARALLKLLGDAPVDKVRQAASDAEVAQKKLADQLGAVADTAMIRAPIPAGVLDRGVALGIGVGLSIITLLLSFLSVRVSSMRRLTTLVPLREAARAGHKGVHAAALLKLAAHDNGGQPGMVIGAAAGGLVSGLAQPLDADVFIVGVMAGCLFGLIFQWILRVVYGASRWRARATELAEVEKPAVPIVLVLSGVNPGLEGQFIKFFNGLSPSDAALTVEKLAAQAEEQILAAADAARHQQQPPQPTQRY